MTLDQNTAQAIAKRLQEASKLCDSSLRTVMLNEGLGQVKVYGRLVADFMGYAFTNILAPIWKKYPELEPEEMKEPYVEPVPTLTPESKDALRTFLVEACAAVNYVKSSVGPEECKRLFRFGGVAEVEEKIRDIEAFLEKPRFRDTKEE
jgi:hypothetical protein